MKINVSEEARALMVEPFKVDADGKPLVEFKMEYGPTPGRAIKALHHSLKALPSLQSIDIYIDALVENIGKPDTDTGILMNDWQVLAAHASKIMGQAIYLDSHDRNSWQTISQTLIHEPGSEKSQSRYSLQLKSFWKGALEEQIASRKQGFEAELGI